MGPGGGVGSAGGAGQPGKRRPAGGGGFIDTGGDMGFGSAGGGFVGNRGGGSGFGGADSRDGGSSWNSGSSKDAKSSNEPAATINMDQDAPIPGEPQLYSEGDMFHIARVTFTVKLVDDTTAEPGV